jgi:hypothetical protein
MKCPGIAFACAALLSVWVLAGCDSSPKNYTVDFNGYLCSACNAKFFTQGKVHAQQCANCKDYGIEDVVTYVCRADQARTVSVRRGQGGVCKQCNAVVSASDFPTEADLTEWGAVKKNKAEVGAN